MCCNWYEMALGDCDIFLQRILFFQKIWIDWKSFRYLLILLFQHCLNPLTWKIANTAQKAKFSITDFFSKCDQIRRKLRIWAHFLKKSLIENFIFCAVKVCLTIFEHYVLALTLSWLRSLLYRDQSIDLHSWFPYDRNLRHERVKVFVTIFLWYIDTELMESFCLLDFAM